MRNMAFARTRKDLYNLEFWLSEREFNTLSRYYEVFEGLESEDEEERDGRIMYEMLKNNVIFEEGRRECCLKLTEQESADVISVLIGTMQLDKTGGKEEKVPPKLTYKELRRKWESNNRNENTSN